MAYLDDHPNRTLAQQRPRRDSVSGVVVVHTAESALDVTGEDTGAEGVARYISQRSTYGSYHRLMDSDSIVRVARFEMTVYGDGTGSNDHAIHLSFACRAADWPKMSDSRKAAFIRNGVAAAHEARDWLATEHGIVLPARRITRAQSDQRVPGFISHAERDPARRGDPGPFFPWEAFLSQFGNYQEDDMFEKDDSERLKRIEEMLENDRKRETARYRRMVDKIKVLRRQGRATKADLDDLIATIEEQD